MFCFIFNMVSTEKNDASVNFSVGAMVRKLMGHFKMTEADLCRGVNLPQTTINRLLTGQTCDPRISTLTVLAEFFDVSLGQLVGKEKLVLNPSYNQAKGSTIPVIDWANLQTWLTHQDDYPEYDLKSFVKTEKALSAGSFAIKTPIACESVFGKGSLLIMNRLQDLKPLEGQMVLVEFSAGQYGLRQVLQEGSTYYLKRLFAPFEVSSSDDKSIFHACVVEARTDKFVA